MNFIDQLKEKQQLVAARLDQALPAAEVPPDRIHQAMRHSMNAGGKRLRPILVLSGHELFPSFHDPLPAAVAIECIHTYSLIHDDLPAMDDSELRRGQPACHKAFDEATAILAGDAFQPLAFEILARSYRHVPKVAVDLIEILARTAGSEKLVGGQMQDLLSEGDPPQEETLSYIHANKTAAMIEASLCLGFRLGRMGEDDGKLELIGQAGHFLGLAFQAVDDLLDVTRTSEELGKDAAHDRESGKVTWISLYGEEKARELALEQTEKARQILLQAGGNNAFLLELVSYMLERES